MAADEDDDGFGDFTFAPSINAVNSNPKPTNGLDSTQDDGDDDWGDFVDSAGLSHSLSLPKFSSTVATQNLDKPRDLVLDQPGSTPARATSAWEKPTGALPLSIFGELEEEEESGAGDPTIDSETKSFNLVKKEVASPNVSELIADLHKSDSNVSNPVEKVNVNGSNSWGWVNPTAQNGLNLDWNMLHSNQNGLNFALGSNQNGLDLDALSSNQTGSNQDSKVLAFDPLSSNGNGVKFNTKVSTLDASHSNQNGLNLDSKVPTSVVEDKSLSTNGADSGLVSDNGGFSNKNEDDGWEFQGAERKASHETCKSGQVNTENGPVSNFNGPNSIWSRPNSGQLVTSSEEFWGNGKWEFQHAKLQPVIGYSNTKEDERKTETSSRFAYMIGVGSDAQDVGHLFGSSLEATQKSYEEDFLFDFKPNPLTRNSSATVKENHAGNGLSVDEKFDDDENSWVFKDAFSEVGSKENDAGNGLSVDGKSDDDENSWAFKDAFSEIGLKDEEKPHDTEVSSVVGVLPSHGEVQENKIWSGNHKGALPVSIFGNDEEVDDPVVFQDISMRMPISSHADGIKSHHANIPISDLLSSLYSQAEQKSSFNHEQSPSEDELGSTNTIIPPDVKIAANDFDDNSWDFKDASSQLQANDIVKSSDMYNNVSDLISSLHGKAVQNTSFSHTENKSENGSLATKTVTYPNLPNGGDTFGDNSWDFKHAFSEANIDGDFDDDTWEFKDASSGTEAEDQTGKSNAERPTEVDKTDYLDFFSKLKGELNLVALRQLENLKKAKSAAAAAGEDSRLEALNKDVQDLENELYQDGLISSELQLDYSSSRNISLNEFVEVLKEPRYWSFESDYQLSKKLTQVEDSPRLVIELIKYVNLTMKILELVSVVEQSNYVSAWSKILSVCTQELKHGALIWKQSLQRNVQEPILSKPQGKKQIIALGEIFRVAELLGCSVRLYKPWIFANSVDTAEIMSLLSECSTLWSSSGLKEALGSISDLDGFEYDGSPETLVESIQHIHNLDIFTLYNDAFSGQDNACKLSLLTPGIVPGMKTVVWNEERYFLPLANLWANLISSDAPSLPSIHVR